MYYNKILGGIVGDIIALLVSGTMLKLKILNYCPKVVVLQMTL